MEELSLGPNGGLIYCFEFLLQNLDFLTTAIESLTEEHLIIFDLPGQIELYTHIPLLPSLIHHLSQSGPLNISLCAAYLLEATFVIDRAKYFAGTLSAMSAMIMLELPHFNILSKMDLIKDVVGQKELRRFLDPDHTLLDEVDAGDNNVGGMRHGTQDDPLGGVLSFPARPSQDVDSHDPTASNTIISGGSFRKLNRAVANLIDDFSMVSFLRLNLQDEESIGHIVSYIDDAIQYHEAQEPRETREYEQAEPAWQE